MVIDKEYLSRTDIRVLEPERPRNLNSNVRTYGLVDSSAFCSVREGAACVDRYQEGLLAHAGPLEINLDVGTRC